MQKWKQALSSPPTEHTDGDPAMKDDANRPQKRTRLAWTLSLLLLPLAAGSGAQDSLRWRGSAAYAPPPAPQAPQASVHAVPPTRACRGWR